MFEKISGFKTYFAVALALVWTVIWLKIPGAKDAVKGDDFLTVLAGILAFAGISLRAGVAKAEAAKGGLA